MLVDKHAAAGAICMEKQALIMQGSPRMYGYSSATVAA
jgi:hypothetical protein